MGAPLPGLLKTLTLALAAVGSPCFAGDTPAGGVRDFYNVLAPDGADPWVWRHADGHYYLTMTTGRDIVVSRSDSLSGLDSGERKVVWTPPPEGPFSRNVWAPELHHLGGKWYIYFAADDGVNDNHRMYVLENEAEDPLGGEFRFKGKLSPPGDDRWAIDGTVFQAGERLYFLWSGWEGLKDVRQDLYIAPMRDPWTLAGPRVAISRPTFPWESRGGPPAVNEGPAVLVRGRSVFVVYAASGSWTDHHCLGLLSADADRDLLSPASWTKREQPVFAGGNGVVAPGHCSFTRSPDGSEDWMIYHAARYRGAGWARNVRAQRFVWGEEGTPRLGAPVPPDTPIPLPSGEPPHRRFEAEDSEVGLGARPARLAGASHGAGVDLSVGPESFLQFQVPADSPGPYNLSVRFAGDAGASTRPLSVNGGPPRAVRFVNSGRESWSNVLIRVDLKPGPNRVRLGPGSRPEAIDCIDVFPSPPARPAR